MFAKYLSELFTCDRRLLWLTVLAYVSLC